MAEYDIPSRGFDPTGSMLRALQMLDTKRQLDERPLHDLQNWQRLQSVLEDLPDDLRDQAKERFLRGSTLPRGDAERVQQQYMQGRSAMAQAKLQEIQDDFQQALDRGLAKIKQDEINMAASGFGPEQAQAARMELLKNLSQRSNVLMRAFEAQNRGLMSQPGVQESFGSTRAMTSPEGLFMTQQGFRPQDVLGARNPNVPGMGTRRWKSPTESEEVPMQMLPGALSQPGIGMAMQRQASTPFGLSTQQKLAGINPLAAALDPKSQEARRMVENAEWARMPLPEDAEPLSLMRQRRDVTVQPLEGAYRQRPKRYVPTPAEQMNTRLFGGM